MYNKAALAAYITQKCHEPERPIGRVKLAKLFYLVQRKAELELTETFAKRAAGPLDDEIYKFLSLAQKKGWVVLGQAQGRLKPVWPGANAAEAAEQVAKLLGRARTLVDHMLEQMKGWEYPVLECWATVLEAIEALDALGSQVTVASVKGEIQRPPDWRTKLGRKEFWTGILKLRFEGCVASALFRPKRRRNMMTIKPGNHGKSWTAKQIEQLQKLADQNTPTRVIALKLGRTEDAVRFKASEENITLKPTNQSPVNGRRK